MLLIDYARNGRVINSKKSNEKLVTKLQKSDIFQLGTLQVNCMARPDLHSQSFDCRHLLTLFYTISVY